MLSILRKVIKAQTITILVKNCFGSFCEPLKNLFNLLIETCFSRRLKNSKCHSDKGEDIRDVSNYRPISVFPCFSKILERIMYNRLYKYLIENNILYSKQFYLQNGHSTDHAVDCTIS